MNRLVPVDIAKGIAILLVVVNHAGEGIFNAGIGVRNDVWKHFHDVCYTFMVPVFFLFSGMFAQLSTKNIRHRFQNIISSLVYPYVLWSLIQAGLMIVTKAGNKVPEWGDLPEIIMRGWMQFWFLHCLILIMIMDLLLRKFNATLNFRICGAVIITSLAILGFDFLELDHFARHLIYFEVGVFGAFVLPLLKDRVNPYGAFVASAFFLGAMYMLGAAYGDSLRLFGAFSGMAGCIALSTILAKSPRLAKIFCCLGEFSLQIYVMHVIFSAGLRVLLHRMGNESFAVHLILGSSIGVIGPLILGRLAQKYDLPLFRLGNLGRYRRMITT